MLVLSIIRTGAALDRGERWVGEPSLALVVALVTVRLLAGDVCARGCSRSRPRRLP